MDKRLLCNRIILFALFCFVLGAPFSITITQVAFFLGLLGWFVKSIFEKQKPKFGPLEICFILFILSTIISSIFSEHSSESFIRSRELFFILIIYLFSNNLKKEKIIKFLLFVLILSTVVTSIYGFILYTKGMQERLSGRIAMPLTFGGILMIVISVGVSLFLDAEKREKLFLFPSILILIAALAFNLSRGAWVGLFCSLLTIGFLRSKKLVILVMAVIVAGYFLLPGKVVNRARSIVDLHESSISDRLCMWRSSIDMIKDHPIIGVGVIDLRDLYDEYKPPEATEIRRGHMHNNFLNVGVHQGIVGLAIFIALFVVIIKDEYRIYKGVLKNKFLSSVVLGSLAAFVGFLVNGIFELNFRDSEVIMLIWFTIGVALASKKLHRTQFLQITAD